MTAADQGVPPLTFYTLALNYLPLAQLLTGAALVTTQAASPGALIAGALAWIYLVPPLVCRLALLLFGRPQGRALTQHDRAYKVWWFTYQWQVLFNRLHLSRRRTAFAILPQPVEFHLSARFCHNR